MSEKNQYVGLEALIRIIAHIKAGFATLGHKHPLEDIEDYVVDDILSSTSTNPVQNKVIAEKIIEMENTLNTQTSLIDNKADKSEVAQADWNQNDETAVDYIKNRPFYEEIGEEIIIEQNIPSSSFSVNNGMYVANVAGTKVFSETGTYNIVYDGTLYSNVAVSKMGMNIIILGNIDESDMPVFTTYPFAIMLVRTNNIITIITNDTELTSHDVKIVEVVEIIHELDEKYIPYVTGKKVEGQTFNISGEDIVAGKGAEIFNNYEGNVATGTYSHAEGYNTLASEDYSHSQNAGTKATAFASHAEGETTVASGRGSHSEGRYTIASVDYQHVQGKYNVEDAENKYAHIVGNGTYKQRSNAHTLDWNGNAEFQGDVKANACGGESPISLVEVNDKVNAGKDWNINDENDPAYIKNRPFYTTDPVSTIIVEETTVTLQNGIGQLTSIQPLEVGQEYAITLDGTTYNYVAKMHEGMGLPYVGNGGLLDAGEDTGEPFFIAPMSSDTELGIKINSDVLEHTVSIVGMISEVHKLDEKYISDSLKESINKKPGLKVEGKTFNIYNPESENYEDVVASKGAEIFNSSNNIAIGDHSHAEGYNTTASGNYGAHAEGMGTTASGNFSAHAEGYNTTASGKSSHAEGDHTTASGNYSHAEGGTTTASGKSSHAEGTRTIASGENQHVQGRWSIEDTANKYAHIVGNGTQSKRSNAHTLDWNGNAWFAGDVYVGGTSGTNKDEGSKKLATEEYVDNVMASGSDVFVVNFELTDNEDYTGYNVTTSTTFDEVYDAIQNGKTVIGHATFNALTCVLHAEEITSSSVYFVCINETLIANRITKLTITMSAYYDAVCSIHNLVAYDDNNSVEATAIILKSPNGTRFNITIGDDGVLSATEITE